MTTTSNPEGHRLLTVAEVAERLGLSPMSVYRRVWAGEIPALKLGSTRRAALRIQEDELDAWLYREEKR